MGIFDGEGTICPAFRRDGYVSLHVAVHIGNREVVEMFSKEWGGSVGVRKPSKQGYQTLYTWCITGAKAIPFLECARTKLIIKNEQANLAMLIAVDMSKYSNAKRVGTSCGRGNRFISESDMERRREIGLKIRSLNGARSRFSNFNRPAIR